MSGHERAGIRRETHSILRFFGACSATLLLLLAAGTAAAQAPPRMEGLTLWGIATYWDGVGVGGRYMIPLGNEGLLPRGKVQDRWALEFGADLFTWDDHYYYRGYGHDYEWTELVPLCGVLWSVWVTPRLAFYPKIDLGYGMVWARDWDSDWGDPDTAHDGLFWQGSVGLIFRVSTLSLRAEAGNHMLKAGVEFGF